MFSVKPFLVYFCKNFLTETGENSLEAKKKTEITCQSDLSCVILPAAKPSGPRTVSVVAVVGGEAVCQSIG